MAIESRSRFRCKWSEKLVSEKFLFLASSSPAWEVGPARRTFIQLCLWDFCKAVVVVVVVVAAAAVDL